MRRLLRYLSTALILGLILTLTLPTSVMAASITLTSTGTVGSIITISGSGFAASETGIEVTFGGTIVLNSLVAEADGTWSDSFQVPEKQAGTYIIDSYGDVTVATSVSNKNFTVIPSISLSKTSATAGTAITISGKGFQGNDNSIDVLFDTTSVLTVASNTNGSFPTTSFNIPAVASGTHTITVTDTAATPNTATSNFTTISKAAITLNKTSGVVGSSITITGSGFVGGESSIVVTYDGNPAGPSTTASSTGSWSLPFNIPASTGGTHTIHAYGALTKTSEVIAKTISVTPGLTLSKNSGPPGTQITVAGSGFGDSEQGITVTWDSNPIGNPANSGRTGSWTSIITIPLSSSGPHNINAFGPTTNGGTTNINFTVGAGISLNPTSGSVGTSIVVSGAGFGTNDKNISVNFEGVSNSVATVLKTTEGAWTASFTVPPSTGGDHTVTATVGSTKVTATFSTVPSVKLDMTTASAGSIITASGTGFGPSQKNIAVKFDDTELVGNIAASATGAWTTSFPVPNAASGSHIISISGAAGIDLSIDDISFKIKPAVVLSLESGTVGTTVVIKGTGFIGGSSINITYDDNNLVKITALSDGSFSKSVVIPTSKAGEHEIKASDSSNTALTYFTIDGTTPAVPKPISPIDGQTLGFMSKITPSFTWSKVISSSQITYNFQLDSDPEFSNPLEKTGLTVTKYSLNRSEALPRGEYYWRVKAIDAAGNESPWSQAQYLKSGLISPFLFTLLLILVIAGLGYGVFFLLTKFLPRRRAAQVAASSPEIVIPEIVNAEFKQIESGKSALPWRLALPQAPQQAKGSKNLSAEDQARLKVIIDFARSLPLPQPDSNTGWLVELAENVTGNSISPSLYAQLLNGEIQVRYEPAWMHHPTFLDLQALLEGQPIMQDLTTFVDSINNLTSSANQVLQDIYHDVCAQVSWDLISNGGWAYISGIYTDGVGWFLGKNLREPSDRDYSVKAESAADAEQTVMGLYADQNTAFPGLLAKAPGETEVQQLRALHLKLRRAYRSSDKLKDLVSLITQLEFQRNRLLNAFSQFNRLST